MKPLPPELVELLATLLVALAVVPPDAALTVASDVSPEVLALCVAPFTVVPAV